MRPNIFEIATIELNQDAFFIWLLQFGADLTFPLYLYPETNTQQTINQSTERTSNLNTEIIAVWEKA
ncbi:MAG: hypothetical protein Q8R57_16900 [Bacteroidota bacterium]|nr:hypothetical protein [Bacteroidota bacterium]